MFEVRFAPSCFRSFAGGSPTHISIPCRRLARRAGLLAFILCSLAISGRAEVRKSAGNELLMAAGTPGLTISPASLSFGTVQPNTSRTKSVTLTSSGTVPVVMTAASISGSGFTITEATLPPNTPPTLPVTLAPGQTATIAITFDPKTAGAAAGTLTLSNNATAGGRATVSLSGTGQSTAAPSAVSCSSSSLTGATTDACTVTLTSAASSGGLTVDLSSNNSAVKVPASVAVSSGATKAAFTATASAVTTTQTATITATANGGSAHTALQLSAGGAALSVSSSSIAFGNVDLNAPETQSAILTSSGTAPVTISAGKLTGTGFAMTGAAFPLTLQPGQTATLEVTFDPTTAGAASGAITLTSNSSMGSMTVTLSGTGQASSYEVELTWDAPVSSADPVAGYNIYRAASGGSFQLLNTAVNAPTSYTDSRVAGGIAYTYHVTSVDAEGNQSAPSNTYNVTIP